MCCYRLLGRIEVHPAFNVAEHEYLLAFAESRRWQRPDGPYAVPGNPAAECLSECLSGPPDTVRWAAPADGQPGLYCPWRPADDGGALVPHTDRDAIVSASPSEVAEWLRYLLTHFLGPQRFAADGEHCPGAAPGFGDQCAGHAAYGVAVVAQEVSGAPGHRGECGSYGMHGSCGEHGADGHHGTETEHTGGLMVVRAHGDRVSLRRLDSTPDEDPDRPVRRSEPVPAPSRLSRIAP